MEIDDLGLKNADLGPFCAHMVVERYLVQIPLYDQMVAERLSVVFYRSANAVQWFSVVGVRFHWSSSQRSVGDHPATAPSTTKFATGR